MCGPWLPCLQIQKEELPIPYEIKKRKKCDVSEKETVIVCPDVQYYLSGQMSPKVMITSHFQLHHFKKRFHIVHQICHTIIIHILFTSVVLPQLLCRSLLSPWILSSWGPDLLALPWPAAKLSVLGTSSARLRCWVSGFLDSMF